MVHDVVLYDVECVCIGENRGSTREREGGGVSGKERGKHVRVVLRVPPARALTLANRLRPSPPHTHTGRNKRHPQWITRSE